MADVRLTATNPEDSSVVPVACDASGRLLLEEQGQGPPGPEGPPGPKGDDGDPFSGNFASDVTFGGKAEFAGRVSVGTDALPISNNFALKAVNNASAESGTAAIFGSNYGGGRLLDLRAGGTARVLVENDGSATFAGQVHSDNLFESERASADSGQMYFKGITSGVINTTLFADGSATFAGGNVAIANGTRGKGKLEIYRTGSGDPALVIGTETYSQNAVITNDGSATFAGGKAGFTEEGYLWCTTRRGDTVVLDFTSNGTGQWVEYTPTSRIDEIRDQLDANRGDTGEMPADTQ